MSRRFRRLSNPSTFLLIKENPMRSLLSFFLIVVWVAAVPVLAKIVTENKARQNLNLIPMKGLLKSLCWCSRLTPVKGIQVKHFAKIEIDDNGPLLVAMRL